MRKAYAQGGPPCRSSGFVQVLALAGLITVSGLVVAGSSTALFAVQEASTLRDRLQREVVLSSALRYGLASGRALGPDFASFDVAIDDQLVTLYVEPEGGKIDIGSAPPQLLRGYLLEAGLSTANPEALLRVREALADERTALNTKVLSSLLTHIDLESLNQDITSFGSAGIDPRYATERVLRAIPGLGRSDVAAILAERSRSADPRLPASAYFTSAGPKFTLVAEIAGEGGSHSVKRMPFEVTSSGSVLMRGPQP